MIVPESSTRPASARVERRVTSADSIAPWEKPPRTSVRRRELLGELVEHGVDEAGAAEPSPSGTSFVRSRTSPRAMALCSFIMSIIHQARASP